MRIIKLSDSDIEFPDITDVDIFFKQSLKFKKPPGLFLLTKKIIGKDGITEGERLLFTYHGKCVYQARSTTPRIVNTYANTEAYPYCIVLDLDSIMQIQGSLLEIEEALKSAGRYRNITKTQAWPMLPDDSVVENIVDSIVLPKAILQLEKSSREAAENQLEESQGFITDAKLRQQLELFGMSAAKKYFTGKSYAYEDHSKNQPYDLKCTRGNEVLFVEVKATQSQGTKIIVTNGEVEFAKKNPKNMALFVLHSIKVSKIDDKYKLTQGKTNLILPWHIDEHALSPISFTYKLAANLS